MSRHPFVLKYENLCWVFRVSPVFVYASLGLSWWEVFMMGGLDLSTGCFTSGKQPGSRPPGTKASFKGALSRSPIYPKIIYSISPKKCVCVCVCGGVCVCVGQGRVSSWEEDEEGEEMGPTGVCQCTISQSVFWGPLLIPGASPSPAPWSTLEAPAARSASILSKGVHPLSIFQKLVTLIQYFFPSPLLLFMVYFVLKSLTIILRILWKRGGTKIYAQDTMLIEENGFSLGRQFPSLMANLICYCLVKY